jgi:MFS family permease
VTGGLSSAAVTAPAGRVRVPREAYLLACGLFLSVASSNLVTPLLPAIRSGLGISVASIGTYVSAYGLARLIVDLPSGAWAARAGPRRLVVAGVSLNALSSLGAVFAPNFGVLLVARIGAGVGAGLLGTVVLSALSNVAPPQIRGRVLSLYQVANNLGIAIYPLAGGAIGSLLGWRAGFAAGAVAAVLSGVVLRPVMNRAARGATGISRAAQHTAAPMAISRAVFAVALGALFFGVVANFINRYGFRNTVLPLYASSHLGLNEVQSAAGITVMSLTGIAVTIPGAALGDRIGRKRVLVTGLAVLAIGDYVYPLVATSFATFMIAGAVVGLGDCFSSSQTALISDMVTGPRRALALGAYRFCVDLGALAGPLLLASLLARFGAEVAIRTAAGILLLAAIVGQLGIPGGRPNPGHDAPAPSRPPRV